MEGLKSILLTLEILGVFCHFRAFWGYSCYFKDSKGICILVILMVSVAFWEVRGYLYQFGGFNGILVHLKILGIIESFFKFRLS